MALTSTLLFQGTTGSRHFEAWSLTGDGTTSTFNPRLACIDHAWLQPTTGVSTAWTVTISAGVVTLTTINNGDVWHLFLIGSV